MSARAPKNAVRAESTRPAHHPNNTPTTPSQHLPQRTPHHATKKKRRPNAVWPNLVNFFCQIRPNLVGQMWSWPNAVMALWTATNNLLKVRSQHASQGGMIFFFDEDMKNRRSQSKSKTPTTQRDPYLGSPSNSSARSGVSPSVQHQEAFREGSTREDAKETAHVMANIRVHRRSHMRATENCMYAGASRALECANICRVCTASSLHLPPVSMASTTSLHIGVSFRVGDIGRV